ncbi:MAG: helix-turn-helix transcriptional regulator [Bacteriovoracaceae bacterium]|nr:helix-turn-helix transcriptional regulator [Bacteriovoracaceae bacterium]
MGLLQWQRDYLMAQFDKEKISLFLGAVRKYMEIRGPMTQRELAEATDTGVSTMSRFLNQQTQELNPNLIANITAKLNIPPMEIIDFVEEDYSDEFLRLVKFYKGEEPTAFTQTSAKAPVGEDESFEDEEGQEELARALDEGGSKVNAQASIKVGSKKTKLAYVSEGEGSLKDKIKSLSLHQKGFLSGFLTLDNDGRDLVANVGNEIINHLKQKGLDDW